MHAVPIELKATNAFVSKLHRPHAPIYRDKFRLDCMGSDAPVGIVQIRRPISRYMDDGAILEVVRLCSNGRKTGVLQSLRKNFLVIKKGSSCRA